MKVKAAWKNESIPLQILAKTLWFQGLTLTIETLEQGVKYVQSLQ